MSADGDNTLLRERFRKFKRLASRLRDGREDLGDDASLRFSMNMTEGEGATASFSESAPIIRFAALLRPFMDDTSPVELQAVWAAVTTDELVDPETKATMARNFIAVEDLGMAFELSGKLLTARDVYFAYAEGEFFDEKPDAKSLLDGLTLGPFAPIMKQMAPFMFYSACSNFAQLVFVILDVILSIERSRPEFTLPPSLDRRCIYCLTTEGDFSAEGHVIPESLGLDEMVMNEAECWKCNNDLSVLDQFLCEFEPIAILRVQYVSLTKKGKFPRAETADVIVEKTKPRHLRFTSKNQKRVFSEEPQPDGTIKLSWTARTGRPVDMRRLARAIFKIALGVVAYDAGVAYACDSRFDAARAFIRGEGDMPNHMLMVTGANPPNPSITTQWHPELRTVVGMDFFGVGFAVNLEQLPLDIHPEVPAGVFVALWLGGGHSKKGVIPPCRTSDCVHVRRESSTDPVAVSDFDVSHYFQHPPTDRRENV